MLPATPPSLLVIASPTHREPLPLRPHSALALEWDLLGHAAASFAINVTVGARVVAHALVRAQRACHASAAGSDGFGRALVLQACADTLPLPAGLPQGVATLAVQASGAPTPFALAHEQEDTRAPWVEARASVSFFFRSA